MQEPLKRSHRLLLLAIAAGFMIVAMGIITMVIQLELIRRALL